MKARFFLCLFNASLFLSFAAATAENVFSQTPSSANSNNYYAFAGSDEKTARAVKTVTINRSDEKVKTATETSKPTVAKSSFNRAEVERRVFDLVNERRTAAGLSPLSWNENVAGVARYHSQNMADHKFFSHTGADGKKVSNRADALGVKKWHALGENIAYNRGFKSPLESAVQSWMNSPGHRDNILKNDWQESGIGVVVSEDGAYYFTQVFLKK